MSGDEVFFAATGITDGDLLKGVRYWGDGASTESLVMRSKTGHHPQDPGHPPLAEADALLGRQVRLTPARSPVDGTSHPSTLHLPMNHTQCVERAIEALAETQLGVVLA